MDVFTILMIFHRFPSLSSQTFLIDRKPFIHRYDLEKTEEKRIIIGRERKMKAVRERVTLSQWMSREGRLTLITANRVQR